MMVVNMLVSLYSDLVQLAQANDLLRLFHSLYVFAELP